MRVINVDSVKRNIEELKKGPWYNEKYLDHFFVRKEAVEVVERLCIDEEPIVDAVPVVRCKDCKYKEGNACDYSAVWVRPNGYCQWGERKEDETT